MDLREDKQQEVIVGQFGHFRAGFLVVPPTIASLARRYQLTSAEELCSWASVFPDEVAAELRWRPEEVSIAAEAVWKVLGVKLPPLTERSYGADPPPGVEKSRTTAADLAQRRINDQGEGSKKAP